MKKKILVIVGPTGCGKTALSVQVAKKIDGEIISMDSMQVYRGMNIGTAKVTEEEKHGIAHHLIDIADPLDDFSCADYRVLAERKIDEIIARGNKPILCGGTGLYLDTLLKLNGFSPNVPDGIRVELGKKSKDELWKELCEIDPESASKTHSNNVKRVIRAIEIYRGTGITKSEWDRRSLASQGVFEPLVICLGYSDRQKLYDAINRRVDIMLENGLEEECERLNLPRNVNSAQAIGYKEIYMWIDGKISREEAVELLKKNTRNYAKRQLTWFRRYTDALRYYRDTADFGQIVADATEKSKKHFLSVSNE